MTTKKKIAAFNIQNEQVVLANMIKSNKIRRRLSKDLKSYHWLGKKHRQMFMILCKMAERNLEFDLDTFETLMSEQDDFGGVAYVQKIINLFEENANIDFHVEVLKTDAIKHHIKERRMSKLVDAIDDPHSNVFDVVAVVDKIKEEIRENFTAGGLLSGEELKEGYKEDYKERRKKSIFTPTGIRGLDRWLNEGLARKKCSVWSARPGMGKTTTVANIVLRQVRGIKDEDDNWIVEPKKVLVVPLETGYVSYIDIMVAVLIKERLETEKGTSAMPGDLVGVPLDQLVKYSDQIDDATDELINWAIDQIFENDNLTVTDDPYMTLDKLNAILENGNYDMCFIDLWEKLMDVTIDASSIASKLNRTQAIAKDCNVHMGIVHQVRRPNDPKAKVKKPTMEMLKNSGAYEEIADLIVFMHRGKYYNPDLEEDVIEYIVGKQRRGIMNKTVFHDFLGDFGMIGDHRKNYVETEEEDF